MPTKAERFPLIARFSLDGREQLARVVPQFYHGAVPLLFDRPSGALGTRELVARVKAQGLDCQSSYGLFVKERALKPEIDMKEFRQIWGCVDADQYRDQQVVDFRLTHYEVLTMADEEPVLIPACVTSEAGGVVQYILDFGNGHTSAGSSPREYFDQSFVKASDVVMCEGKEG